MLLPGWTAATSSSVRCERPRRPASKRSPSVIRPGRRTATTSCCRSCARSFRLIGRSSARVVVLRPARAARRGRTPTGLRGVILAASFVTTPVPYVPRWARRLATPALFRFYPAASRTKALLGGHGTREVCRLLAEAHTLAGLEALASRARATLSIDASDALAACPVPVLYLRARKDGVIRGSQADEIRRLRPRWRSPTSTARIWRWSRILPGPGRADAVHGPGGRPRLSQWSPFNRLATFLACLTNLSAPASPQAIATGAEHVCALYADADVPLLWQPSPTPDGGTPRRRAQLRRRLFTTCGLRRDATAVCWGGGKGAEPGSGDSTRCLHTARRGGQHDVGCADQARSRAGGGVDRGQTTPPAGSFSSIGMGADHGCAVDKSGALRCWAKDFHGETHGPTAVRFVQVAPGAEHTCALTAAGAVRCWGEPDDVPAPRRTSDSPPSRRAAFTPAAWPAIRRLVWGSNSDGKCSPPAAKWKALSAKANLTGGLRLDGKVECWGQLPAKR